MFLQVKSFLEKIDYYRDLSLTSFIKKYWPRWLIPNYITYLRFVVAFIILWLLVIGYYNKAVLIPLILVGALTDILDGSVARILKMVTKLGEIIDPIADRVLIIPVALFSLINHYIVLLFLLIVPELYNGLLALYCKIKRIEVKPNIFGKFKMVFYCVGFIYIFIFDFPRQPELFPIILLYISLLFLVVDMVFKTKKILKKNA